MGRAASAKAARKEQPLLKLDLGCGQNKRDGFLGVDKFSAPGVDQTVDLFSFPWPWKDGTVEETHCSHHFEHVPALLRPRWMEELYRVLIDGGKGTFIVPYFMSSRSVQDFTHEWPPVCEASFLYFNQPWREANKLTHGLYDIHCDFDFTYGYAMDPTWASRQDEARNFAIRHYWHTVSDLYVTVVKRASRGVNSTRS
jgi:hypothetical protein